MTDEVLTNNIFWCMNEHRNFWVTFLFAWNFKFSSFTFVDVILIRCIVHSYI